MKNEDLTQFWDYTNGKNVEKIDKKCTFEDYFKNKNQTKRLKQYIIIEPE